MNPYFTDADIVQRVIAAAKRGVKVRIVVSETSNNGPASAALKYHYGALIHAGVEIWEYPGAVVHAKLVVADDTVVFGTVNFDAWALYRNYEDAMMARSPAAARLFEERVFGPDIARSHPGTAPKGLGTRLGNWFWDRLSYFLSERNGQRRRPQHRRARPMPRPPSRRPSPVSPRGRRRRARRPRQPSRTSPPRRRAPSRCQANEPRERAPTPASAIRAKMITSHPLCGP